MHAYRVHHARNARRGYSVPPAYPGPWAVPPVGASGALKRQRLCRPECAWTLPGAPERYPNERRFAAPGGGPP